MPSAAHPGAASYHGCAVSPQVHQVLVSASPGDAVTTAARELQAVLARLGPSDIYAAHPAPELAGHVFPLSRYPRPPHAGPADLLLVHVATGIGEVAAFVAGRRERVALVYHGLPSTPVCRALDPHADAVLEASRRELASMRDRATVALAGSGHGARQLEALGFADVRVTPLPADPARLLSTTPDAATEHHLTHVLAGPAFVFVGGLLPAERPHLLLQAFHVLATFLLPGAHLILVGPAPMKRYRDVVHHFARQLGLAHAVWITGDVSRSELAAFYRRADVFVTAGDHVGFCSPVLEATAFDVPVVARSQGATPEVLGDAGLLVPAEDGPFLLAEAMAAAATDETLRSRLVAAARRRLQQLDPEQAAARLLGHVLDVA
ncbi:MAG: hypothetical protein CYG61_06540 [Actinobacteria bacterium]|nr:MAG: hypothetical protein CYG61_06540 [Actinomycetota bacterium]